MTTHHTTCTELSLVPSPRSGEVSIHLEPTMTDYRHLQSTLSLMIQLLILECEELPWIESIKLTLGGANVENFVIPFKAPDFDLDKAVELLAHAVEGSFSPELFIEMVDPMTGDFFPL